MAAYEGILSALLKWLSKYKHVLSEPQLEAAKRYANARLGEEKLQDVVYNLANKAPKESKDIDWLYMPDLKKADSEMRGALGDMQKQYPEWEILSKRTPEVENLMKLLREESPTPQARLFSKYHLKE